MCIVMAKPPSNAQQERIFSRVSWFDSHLMASQKSSTFEMRCLDSLNRGNVDEIKESIENNENTFPNKEWRQDITTDKMLHRFMNPEGMKFADEQEDATNPNSLAYIYGVNEMEDSDGSAEASDSDDDSTDEVIDYSEESTDDAPELISDILDQYMQEHATLMDGDRQEEGDEE
jgi:hypothetical protein